METLIHAIRIHSQDIGMEFCIEKGAMLVMKTGKRHLSDRIELPNHDKIRTLEETDTIKLKIKDKLQKEYLRGTRKLLDTKLFCINLIK